MCFDNRFFFSFENKKKKVFGMSTLVDTWKGGDNLVLVDGVSRIASKHVGRPEDMVKELLTFFTGDLKKTEVLKGCLEKMRDVSDRFKTERRS